MLPAALSGSGGQGAADSPVPPRFHSGNHPPIDCMIEIKNLSKHFGPKVAVDSLSLNVQKGEVLGFLGPNGAGKSTAMRMITGYLPPTAGSVAVGGADIVDDPNHAKQKIGYLPESAPLYAD